MRRPSLPEGPVEGEDLLQQQAHAPPIQQQVVEAPDQPVPGLARAQQRKRLLISTRVVTVVSKIGLVAAHRANAQRLLYDEGRLAIVGAIGVAGAGMIFGSSYAAGFIDGSHARAGNQGPLPTITRP
mgnify:CR=1 FL=1